MKKVVGEYLKIITYTIFGLIMILSSYMIIINIHHYNSLREKIVVSEIDSDYTKYKKQVNDIGELLNKKNTNASLNDTYQVLKNGGVFRLIPKTSLSYHDLYELNEYFINEIINNCWVSKLKTLNKNTLNEEMINILISSSKYLNNDLLNNGLVLYDDLSDDKIHDSYYTILKNYVAFSNVVINIINDIGGANG